jgi:tetratricopeptide (TPR) repeat protein
VSTKTALYIVIGLLLVMVGAVIYLVRILPGIIVQQTTAALAPSAPTLPTVIAGQSPSTIRTPDFVKQELLDEVAQAKSRGLPAPDLEAIVATLTSNDLQVLSGYATQVAVGWQKAGTTDTNPSLSFPDPRNSGLSRAGMEVLPLLLSHEMRLGRAAQQEALKNVPSVDLSGRPPPPGAMTADQAAAYRQQAATNTFEIPIPPANLPPILQDSSSIDGTEDNWLARLIVQDIAGQVITGLHLRQSLTDLPIHVDVNDDDAISGDIHVHLMQWIDDPQLPAQKLNQPLRLNFAWDDLGYSVLAEYLIGTHPIPPQTSDPDSGKLLGDLLDLNGPLLAREDVRLSALLQKNPLDPGAQSEAALVLAAMAWRENAGEFSDNRRLLCKATAHLALAMAVDSLQKQPPDWNARVADAALRVLAGRETDALQCIDALSAQPDVPDAAKAWLATLRFWSTGDWRQAKVDASSPLLMKIAWFQVLCADLSDLGATSHLDETGDLAKVPDWGRAVLGKNFSVENGNRFAQSTLALEMQEATDVEKAEGQPLSGDGALETALTAAEDETVVVDPDHNVTIHVIGSGTFLAASRRHILNAVLKSDHWMRHLLGVPDEARQFEAQATTSFKDLPHFVLVAQHFPNLDGSRHAQLEEILRSKSVQWQLTELPPSLLFDNLLSDSADYRLLSDFYQAGEPLGTVYDFSRHGEMLRLLHIGPRWHVPNDAQSPAKAYQARRAYFEQLQTLNPDSCPLTEAIVDSDHGIGSGETSTQAIASLKRFMDYCITPFHSLLAAMPSFELSDSDLETIYDKEAVLEPDIYFTLGNLLRKQGRIDEAAEADRKGVAQAHDQVLVANSIQPLIDYDLAHNNTDEALALGKRGADVYSADGILSYVTVLTKLNRLDDAETWAKNLQDRYGYDGPLIDLYVTHSAHFQSQFDAIKKQSFPNGMTSVSLNSFSGPPTQGAVYAESSPLLIDSGLDQGDVVVALNSTKIESLKQYDFIRDTLPGSDMDLIVWDKGQYREVHASPPNHLFGVNMNDYPARQ